MEASVEKVVKRAQIFVFLGDYANKEIYVICMVSIKKNNDESILIDIVYVRHFNIFWD